VKCAILVLFQGLMINFQGTYECKLDAKYRTVLPAKLKSCLPENENTSIVVTRGQEPCLTIFSVSVWDEIYQRLAKLDRFSAEARMYRRTYLAGSFTIDLDSQGRFILPKLLSNYASLEENYVMVGIADCIEVWNPELYQQYQYSSPAEFSKMTEKILGEKKPYSFDLNLFKN